MIKGLTGGPGVLVSGGNTALPYVNQNSSDSFSGLLRIWGNDIQYYTNGVWNTLPSSYASVTLDASAEEGCNYSHAVKPVDILLVMEVAKDALYSSAV